MALTNLHDVFQHNLISMHATERAILEELDVMVSEARDPSLRQAFQTHRQQTEGQIRRLEQVLRAVGIEGRDVETPAFEGLVEEKELLVERDPSPEILDVVNVGAGLRTEQLEIACYEELLALASQLGIEGDVAPLKENLQEEQAALQKLMTISRQGLGVPQKGGQKTTAGSGASKRG